MTIHETVANLSREARARVTALYARYEAEEITWEEFTDLAVSQTARSSQVAASLAVLAVSAELSRLTGGVRAPSTAGPGYDIEQAVRDEINGQTSTASFQADGATAMGIAGAAAVLGAYQATSQRAMKTEGATFYRREVGPDACPICQDLADIVLPTGREQWHHKGCACIAVPVSVND